MQNYLWRIWLLFWEKTGQVGAEIKAMEEEGVICAYHTLINWDSTQDERGRCPH